RFSVAASRRRAPRPIQRAVSPQLPPNCRAWALAWAWAWALAWALAWAWAWALAWAWAWAPPSHPRHGCRGTGDVILARSRCRLPGRGQQQGGMAVASIPHGVTDLAGIGVDRIVGGQQADGLRIGPGLPTQSERLGPRVPLASPHRLLLIGPYERVA